MQKRTLIKVAVASATALLLTACGKEEPKTAQPAPAASSAPAAKAEASGPLKVAFVYVSPASGTRSRSPGSKTFLKTPTRNA